MKKRVTITILIIVIIIGAILGVTAFVLNNNSNKSLSAAEYLDLGEKYLLELNYEQALVQFLLVIEIEPKNARAYIGAADAYIGLGDTDSAILILQQGLEELSDNAEIQAMLNELLPPEIPKPTNVQVAEAYLRILRNEGNPTHFDWGWVSDGVISVSVTDLNDDGVPELIYSRIVDGHRWDVLVYGFDELDLVELIRIEGIEHQVSAGGFAVHSLRGGGLITQGGNGGEANFESRYYIYRDLNLPPSERLFERTWTPGWMTDGDETSFIIDGVSMTEEQYASEERRFLSEREHFLTGDNFSSENADVLNVSMTYDEAIALLTTWLNNGADTGNDSQQNQDSSAWRQLYMDYINDNLDPHLDPKYSLFYVNDDNIPELFADYVMGAAGKVVATVFDDTLDMIHYSHYGISYIERGNLMLLSGGRMDWYFDYVYEIRDGKFVRLHTGEFGAEDNSRVEFDSNGNPIYLYFWNDTEMTEAEYKNMLSFAFDSSRATNLWNGYSYNEIMSILRSE
jgi:tetratricopeptide (TPR) repeat protein